MNTDVKFVVLFLLIIYGARGPVSVVGRRLELGIGMMKKQISTSISFREKAKVLAASSLFLKPQDIKATCHLASWRQPMHQCPQTRQRPLLTS